MNKIKAENELKENEQSKYIIVCYSNKLNYCLSSINFSK